PLVARVLVNRLGNPAHRHARGPRPRPGGRIVDLELVEKRIGVQTREALDEMRLRAGPAKARLAAKVRRLDHERAAFPAAPRVAFVLTEIRREMWTAIHR